MFLLGVGRRGDLHFFHVEDLTLQHTNFLFVLRPEILHLLLPVVA